MDGAGKLQACCMPLAPLPLGPGRRRAVSYAPVRSLGDTGDQDARYRAAPIVARKVWLHDGSCQSHVHPNSDAHADKSVEVLSQQPKPAFRSNSTDTAEEVLERGSDVVASVCYPEQRKIGAALNVGSGALCFGLQALCVALFVDKVWTGGPALAVQADLPANTLNHVAAALNALGYASLAVVFGSTRDALRPGGALEQLKVGEVMISEQDGKRLRRWRVGLGVISVFCLVAGMQEVVEATVLPEDHDKASVEAWIRGVVRGLVRAACAALFSGWWHSMWTASCLCRDQVIEVIKSNRSISPSSDEWDGDVAQPALELIDKMRLLSDGWSRGLVGLAAASWLYALAYFVGAINTPWNEGVDAVEGDPLGHMRTKYIQLMAGFSLLPFLLAKDVANTSTWCDNLMEELNGTRTNHGPESHLKIHWLETALKQLVRGISCFQLFSLLQPSATYSAHKLTLT